MNNLHTIFVLFRNASNSLVFHFIFCLHKINERKKKLGFIRIDAVLRKEKKKNWKFKTYVLICVYNLLKSLLYVFTIAAYTQIVLHVLIEQCM